MHNTLLIAAQEKWTRYKYIVQVVIGEQRGEAVRYTSKNCFFASAIGVSNLTDLSAGWVADAFGTPKQMTMLSKYSAM